jgi:uncharacterized membrane protein YfcA
MTPALIGLAVGFVVGLTSTGGGSLLTPALVFVLGVPPAVAVGTDVVIAFVMKLVGGGIYALRKEVHWESVALLASGSVPGALIGVTLLNRIPTALLDGLIRRSVGVALVLSGMVALARLLVWKTAPRRFLSAPVTILLGFGAGVLVAATSIGSGSILLALLSFSFPLSAVELVGTDLAHATLLSGVAALSHLASGRGDLRLAAAVLTGALPGVALGAKLASSVPQRLLRASLAAILIGIGVKLSVTSAPKEARTAAVVNVEKAS